MKETLSSVPRSTSNPAFWLGVPVSSLFNTRILSPIFTVFEFTVVVVPFTVKFPVTVRFPLVVTFVAVISSLLRDPPTVTLLNSTLSLAPRPKLDLIVSEFPSVPVIVTFWLPSKLTEPPISPPRLIVLVVSKVVAVPEFPLTLPVTFPVKLPVNLLDDIFVAPVRLPLRVAPFIVGVVSVYLLMFDYRWGLLYCQ